MNSECDNQVDVIFPAIAKNEQLARMIVSAFIAPLNPTLEEFNDVKTAVSEAVTNAIIHGYPDLDCNGNVSVGASNQKVEMNQTVRLYLERKGSKIKIIVEDKGVGIADVKMAMQPLYTSKPELERSGMGFAFMQEFMSDLKVESCLGNGVKIYMEKEFQKVEADDR